MKKYIIFLIPVLIILSGCAENPLTDTPYDDGSISGFFTGLWHGLIVWFSFIGSIFTDTVSLYDAHNNGAWYDFGFVIGLSLVVGGTTEIVKESTEDDSKK